MPEKKSEKINTADKCPSGIEGFDDITSGGFIRNSTNSIMGGPGAGKSLFLMQFLYNGATKYNENGLYISFENSVVDLFKDAESMSWDFNDLDVKNKCKFMKISPLTRIKDLKKEITKVVNEYKIRRICLDPISLFGAGEENETKLRIALFEITSHLKSMNVTVLLASENPAIDSEETSYSMESKSEYIKFLVDGLVELYSSGLGGVSDRAVRVSKMRRTNHKRGPIPMRITDKGIVVMPKSR